MKAARKPSRQRGRVKIKCCFKKKATAAFSDLRKTRFCDTRGRRVWCIFSQLFSAGVFWRLLSQACVKFEASAQASLMELSGFGLVSRSAASQPAIAAPLSTYPPV